MSLACLLFSFFMAAASCPPVPPEAVRARGEAIRLRPDVEAAVHTANEALLAADEPFRLVPSWHLNDRGADSDEVVVYLAKSPASAQAQAEQRMAMRQTIEAIGSDFNAIDPGADACDDLDDCVTKLYPEATVDTVFDVLNRQNSWELALSSSRCRCIILIEQDLELYRIVFGADWDRYILLTQFNTVEEFQSALASGRLPDALLDGETVPLPAMLVFLMLHEVGHLSDRPFVAPDMPVPDGVGAFLSGLGPEKAEEVRADAFAANVLTGACIGRNPKDLLLNSCIAPTMLSMLTFVIGVKGKSREALCLRYLDPTEGYPNWQARLLLLGYWLLPGSQNARTQIEDYLAKRRGLLAKDWIGNPTECARAASLSASVDNARE